MYAFGMMLYQVHIAWLVTDGTCVAMVCTHVGAAHVTWLRAVR